MSLWATLIFLGISFSALYVLPSGNPQPTDWLIAAASGGILLARITSLRGWRLVWPMIFISLWVLLVSITWSFLYPEGNFWKPPMFFIFNTLFMAALVNVLYYLKDPDAFLLGAVRIALVTSGVGVLVSIFIPELILARESLRVTGFFNNPNQLAYYNLCMLASFVVLKKGRIDIELADIVPFGAGITGVMASVSLGGLAGLGAVMLALLVAGYSSLGKVVKLLFFSLTIGIMMAVVDIYSGGGLVERLETRFGAFERKVEQLESERGYDRILAHPQYWWFGAGEGATERFGEYSGLEIHSSFGNMLFAYGVVGISLFLILLWKSLRNAPVYAWFCLGGPLLYSVTHMGLRSTAFWLLVTILLISSDRSRCRSGKKQQTNPPSGQQNPAVA